MAPLQIKSAMLTHSLAGGNPYIEPIQLVAIAVTEDNTLVFALSKNQGWYGDVHQFLVPGMHDRGTDP